MDYNYIWLIGILGGGFIGFFIYKFYKDPEFFVKMTKYRIYSLILITWFYRIFVDFHHKCIWQRYIKYINRNSNFFILNGDNNEVKMANLKKYFWFFQIKYMMRLNRNVWTMKNEMEMYRLKIKNVENVPLNSYMKVHINYKEIVYSSDEEFIGLFIEFLGRKTFDYIEKIEVISSRTDEDDTSFGNTLDFRKVE